MNLFFPLVDVYPDLTIIWVTSEKKGAFMAYKLNNSYFGTTDGSRCVRGGAVASSFEVKGYFFSLFSWQFYAGFTQHT